VKENEQKRFTLRMDSELFEVIKKQAKKISVLFLKKLNIC